MAGLLPLTHDPIPVQREQLDFDQNDKADRVGRNFFSEEGTWGFIGSTLVEFYGKPIIATGVCLITYCLIDRFSSAPSNIVLKVTVIVVAIGFISYHMISLFISEMRDEENQKELINELNIRSEWDEILSLHVERDTQSFEALEVLRGQLQSRRELLAENLIKIDKREIDKIKAVVSFREKILIMRNEYNSLNQIIMSEINNTTVPKDYKDMPLLMGEQTDKSTKIQEARLRQITLMEEMIASYDEILKITGIVKLKNNQ